MLYYADLSRPVWTRTHAYVDNGVTGEEPVLVGTSGLPPYGIITTQTCDLVEEDADPKKPWIQVAPVFECENLNNSGLRKQLKKGRGPAYLTYVPDLQPPGFWVADLRIEVPVEKGWLLGREPIRALKDPKLRGRFAESCSWLRGRTAFSGDFVKTVQAPMSDALRTLQQSEPDLFALLNDHVDEVRVRVDDPLDPSNAQVLLISEAPPPAEVQEWFDSWWDEQRPLAESTGITLLPHDYSTFGTMTAAEYRGSIELPLDHRISPE